MRASLIGRLGSSAFRLSTTAVVDVARGLVLLYGIGTSALPSWDPRMGRSNLMGGLAGSGRSKRTSELTPSIVPRGTPFHRRVELELPPIAIGLEQLSRLADLIMRYGRDEKLFAFTRNLKGVTDEV